MKLSSSRLMSTDLVLVKLGGSVVTFKQKRLTPNHKAIKTSVKHLRKLIDLSLLCMGEAHLVIIGQSDMICILVQSNMILGVFRRYTNQW